MRSAPACSRSRLGAVFVFLYMGLAYGLFGWFANIALLVNILLMLAALSLLEATLTLPGIAGIVLTLGTALDANILINERIREEFKNGRPPLQRAGGGLHQGLRHHHGQQPDQPDRHGLPLRLRLAGR